MYQAGVKNITLYENKGIDFTYYDSTNDNAITDLTGQGTILQVLNDQIIEFDIQLMLGKSGELLNEYTVKFNFLGYTIDNLTTIGLIHKSIYGWCFDVEFYDGTHKFYNVPIKSGRNELVIQREMSLSVELKTSVPTTIIHLDHDPNVSTVPIYRADTTLISADSTIYTADYAL